MKDINNWDLVLKTENLICFSGDVSFLNAIAIRKKGEEIINSLSTSNAEIDLSDLQKIDSSCLSLFVCWVRYAKAKNKTIEFINLPQKITNLSRVSGLDEILPLTLKKDIHS